MNLRDHRGGSKENKDQQRKGDKMVPHTHKKTKKGAQTIKGRKVSE